MTPLDLQVAVADVATVFRWFCVHCPTSKQPPRVLVLEYPDIGKHSPRFISLLRGFVQITLRGKPGIMAATSRNTFKTVSNQHTYIILLRT